MLRDLVVICVVAIIVVVFLQRLGVPTIAGFIVSGALVGPFGLALVRDVHEVEPLAELGVALLLFGIGVELSLSHLKSLWRLVVIAGALQVVLTMAATAGVAHWMGQSVSAAIFIGCVVAVSSTAIVLRGLEARGEVEAPHGRLTLGILVFQDLSVVVMMLAVPFLADDSAGNSSRIQTALLQAIAVIAGVLLLARLIVPRLLKIVANTRQRDLFVLTVMLICLGTAWAVSLAGISLALGAFLAGLVVAGSEFRHQAMADLVPFREAFTSLFFISMGMLFDPAPLWQHPVLVVSLLLAILLGKFLIILLVGALMRLAGRVSVLAASALCQVGEFSFVLLHEANSTDLLSKDLSTNLHAAIILSMLVTPLTILLGPTLAAGVSHNRILNRLLGVQTAEDAQEPAKAWHNHVIIAGYGVTGLELSVALREHAIPYVIVDINADNVRAALKRDEPAYFGDVTSAEVLSYLGIEHAQEIVLAVNDPRAAERAVRQLKRLAPHLHVVIRTRYLADVAPLEEAGASEVIPAELEASAQVAAHILQRHGVAPDAIQTQLEHIRRHKHSPDSHS